MYTQMNDCEKRAFLEYSIEVVNTKPSVNLLVIICRPQHSILALKHIYTCQRNTLTSDKTYITFNTPGVSTILGLSTSASEASIIWRLSVT